MKGIVNVLVPITESYEFNTAELYEFIKKNQQNILWDSRNEALKELYDSA